LFIALVTTASVYSDGSIIPPPNDILDSLIHPEYGGNTYSSMACDEEQGVVAKSHNIGDFDGDGADDVFIEWRIGVKYYDSDGKLLGMQSQWCDFSRYHLGVYSLKKKKYLFRDHRKTQTGESVITGDFDGDGKMDFVIDNKIYLGVNSLYKKKAYP